MVEVGDYILIRDIVIDRQVESAISADNKKTAMRWESYRNMRFKVLAANKNGSITIQDVNNHVIQLSRKSYDTDT